MLPEIIAVVGRIVDILADAKHIDQTTQADLHAQLAQEGAGTADSQEPQEVIGSGGVVMPPASAGSPTS